MKASVFRIRMLGFETPHAAYDVEVPVEEIDDERLALARSFSQRGVPTRTFVTLAFATAPIEHLRLPAGHERFRQHCHRIGRVDELARRLLERAFPEARDMPADRIPIWWQVLPENASHAERFVEITDDDLALVG